ncbi:MAG: dihydroorotate dehydrogenase electron transfer subunit [Clostridiaceae bacterium]|jgi:dihydroorotate dehydrogenase electron transfer subunit|nr:dihydroorotate dehydrogenase electron transfer subunit [Clostridiaceae bacterium]
MRTIEFNCPIIDHESINGQTVVLTLEAPAIAQIAYPGQFVNLTSNQFLRRPIGIMNADPARGSIQLGIRIAGEGTRFLAKRKKGDILSLLGPLGRGFNLEGARRVITVGGGTGVFPLYFVQKVCQARDLEGIAVCGYRSLGDSFLTDQYKALTCQTLFASEEGDDMDFSGHAVAALDDLLAKLPLVPETRILTCGPEKMMASVAALADEYGISCQVSLEERMACGIGVCLVCACKIKRGDEQGAEYQRCCTEGPVFNAEVVEWQI